MDLIKNKDKRAWLRIVEAFIAVLIIMSTLLIVISNKTVEADVSGELGKIQRHILNQISEDSEARNEILSDSLVKANQIASKFIPYGYNYELKVCPINQICSMTAYVSEEVFTQETVISANLASYSPKIVKIFFWKK